MAKNLFLFHILHFEIQRQNYLVNFFAKQKFN